MRVLAFLSICLLLVGCDMADYQRRMDLNRARVKIFDEENKVLGKVLVSPTLKQKDEEVAGWPFDVFLRLPQGISEKIAGEKDYGVLNFQDFRMFQYPGDAEGSALFAVAGLVGEVKKEKTKGEDAGWPRTPPEQFRAQVVATLHEYFRIAYLGNMKFPDSDFKTMVRKNIDVPMPGAEKPVTLAFDRYVFEGTPGIKDKTASAFLLYHHYTSDKQIALVFQMPAAKKDDVTETRKIETSLRTLALGDQAGVRRSEHNKLHRK